MIRMAKKVVAPKAAVPKVADKAVKKSSVKAEAEAFSEKKASADKRTSADKKTAVVGKKLASEKKAAAILTLTDIGDHLATTFEIPKSHAKAYLAESVEMIGRYLKKGTKVRISGLGIFQVKKRAARKGRNPNTGDAIKIKATKRVAFAVSRDLKIKL